VAALAFVACGGGPLQVTAGDYDPLTANAADRSNVDRAEAAAAEAERKRDATAAAIDPAEQRAEAAEEKLEQSPGSARVEAEARLARTELTYARWSAEEAEKAWLVALAKLELAKHVANQGKGKEYEQLGRDLRDQLVHLENQHAAAVSSLNASTQDLNEAKARVENAPSD